MPQPTLGSFSGTWFEVTTPEQAALLSDAVALRHLEPFMGRSLGTAQAAQEAGVSVERMLYRIRQFLGAGLLEQTGVQRRAGRAIRLYRAPAGFRVPFHLTPFPDLEAQIARHGRPFDRLRARGGARRLAEGGGGHARLLYRSDVGEVHSETLLAVHQAASRRPGGDYMGVLWLDEAAAQEVQALLEQVKARLRQGTERREGRAPYLVQLCLVPLNANDPDELLGPPG